MDDTVLSWNFHWKEGLNWGQGRWEGRSDYWKKNEMAHSHLGTVLAAHYGDEADLRGPKGSSLMSRLPVYDLTDDFY